MSMTDHGGTLGGTLGGFEERLLAELKLAQIAAPPPPAMPFRRRAAAGSPRGSRKVALVRRGALGVAAAGAITAAAVTVLLPGRTSTPLISTEEQPLGSLPSHAAKPVLLAMAAKAASAGQGSGRYWCTDEQEGQLDPIGPAGHELNPPGEGGQPSPASDYRYSILEKYRMVDCETPQGADAGDFYQYLGAHPATSADTAAWRRAGSPDRWQGWYGAAVSMKPGSYAKIGKTGGLPPWGNETSLPADPAKLEKLLLTGLDGPNDVATKQEERHSGMTYRQIVDENLFNNLTGLLEEPVRPAVRAAAFRLLAQVPGGQETPGVQDPLGRAGIAVWWGKRGDPNDGFMIIDPETTMLLASEGFAGTPAWVYQPSTMTDYDIYVSVGWVNRLPTSGTG